MTNQRSSPDYDFLADIQDLESPEQFKAIADATRQKLLGLLTERAATTSQLAEALGQPKGTIGHHLRVLLRAGLIRVVRTRQVRALTEKYYGRVAREWRASGSSPEVDIAAAMLSQVRSERVLTDGLSTFLLVHARMSCDDAQRFVDRVQELSKEFTDQVSPGEPMYGFLGGIYLTDWPALESEGGEKGEGGDTFAL